MPSFSGQHTTQTFRVQPLNVNQPSVAKPHDFPTIAKTERSFHEQQETPFLINQMGPVQKEFDPSTGSRNPFGQVFPGLIYTNFDEQTPLPRFGGDIVLEANDLMDDGSFELPRYRY